MDFWGIKKIPKVYKGGIPDDPYYHDGLCDSSDDEELAKQNIKIMDIDTMSMASASEMFK
jgi:hypothetical protein